MHTEVQNWSRSRDARVCAKLEMEQVFFNLFKNAVYAVLQNPGEKHIEVKVELYQGQMADSSHHVSSLLYY